MKKLIVLFCLPCFGQTAITALTSFWEMNVTATDRIAWDSKGSAHGTYYGQAFNADTSIFGGGWHRGSGTQLPFDSGGMTMPGSTVATGASSFAYCSWIRRTSTSSDPLMGSWSLVTSTRSWLINYNATPGYPVLTYGMTDGSSATVEDTGVSIASGDLAMLCMRYNSSDGKVGLSVNGRTWVEVAPAAPFQVPSGDACHLPDSLYDPFYPCTLDFSHIHNQFFPAGTGPVIGRTMFWNGYIPTDVEVTAIYNGGSGRDAAYFGLSYTPPTRPLTVTLSTATFAEDSNLSGQEGLYWLRPFPLYSWSPALAATLGNYVWVRSTDHAVGSANEKLYIGYSASPATLPSSWTKLNPTRDTGLYPGLETPHLEWNADTSKFHLYARSLLNGSSNPYIQKTLVWTSTDLSTWTFEAVALPTNTAACPSTPCYNHTGYAFVVRNGVNDWTAQSLIDSGETGTDQFIRLGLWSSTDGITWSFVRETQTMVPKMPYRNAQNQRIGTHVSTAGSGAVFSMDYVGYPSTKFEFSNPAWPLFEHPGDNVPDGDYLQDVRTYTEGDAVYLYAKWSYQQPSTVRLYTGTLSASARSRMSSGVRISGGARIQ